MSYVKAPDQHVDGFKILAPNDLFSLIQRRGELAVIDVRDIGSFSKGHILFAVSVPLTRIEILINRKVPRKQAPVVIVDSDGNLAREVAQLLFRLGYEDISILDGGLVSWQQAGYEVFSGENVPGKAFGEVVEVEAKTPHISVQELHAKLQSGQKFVVVDGRTPEEFFNFSLPGAHNLPNAELPYRIRELAPDPSTLIVVNCAGRTRSIIGAQTLIDAGVPNPVVSLRDGTMAWLLEGYKLEHGKRSPLPEPSAQHLAQAQKGAENLLERSGVEVIDSDKLRQLRADKSRSTFLFDIRSKEEYRAGHLSGWRWVPGGQLIQATDEYVGTLRSRVVIADWDGVRAATVAAWLVQLGQYEVYVYRPSNPSVLEVGDEPVYILKDPLSSPSSWINHEALAQKLASDSVVVIDVDSARAYAKRHIRGAYFSVAERIETVAPALLSIEKQLVITSSDGMLADAVTRRLKRKGIEAYALLDGNKGWFDAGFSTVSGTEKVLGADHALYLNAYDYVDVSLRNKKFQQYLDWETGLVQQLARKGGQAPFTVLGAVSLHVSHGT